jgi:predicted nuclease of predicted toxin-antitoxin system
MKFLVDNALSPVLAALLQQPVMMLSTFAQ